MATAVSILPAQQLAVLEDTYRKAVARKRLRGALAAAVFCVVLVIAAIGAEVNLRTLFTYFGNFVSYFDRILTLDSGARVWTDPVEWFWGWHKWLRMLGETILISYVGTLTGAVFAFALNFFAAQNTSPGPWVRFIIRRLLEFARTVPGIVFALIFVIAFGLGPMAGVLAIAIHSTGALGKLFAEIVENADMKPVEGIRSTGAELAVLHALCRAAAGLGRLCQLCAAAVRDQCPRGLGDGLRRRRRHRPGARGRDPQVLLSRRQRHPRHHHRHRLHHRHLDRLAARPAVRQGDPPMSQMPRPDAGELIGRHKIPACSSGPPRRRSWQCRRRFVGALAGFSCSGWTTLETSRSSRIIAGLSQLGWITVLMIPPNPARSSFPSLRAGARSRRIVHRACSAPSLAAVLALAAQPARRAQHHPLEPRSCFPVRRFDGYGPRRRYADLGAGLGQRRRPRSVRRRARDHDQSDFGAFGKLFSEAIEAADRKQVEGVRASAAATRCTRSASACCRRCCR
jgi:ABC-type phosphate/phosphonate transport system permease subunit